MARRVKGGIRAASTTSPWGASIFVAVVVYFGLTFLLPAFMAGNRQSAAFAKGLARTAPFVSIVVFLIIVLAIAFLNAAKRRQILDIQKNLETIRSLHWSDFELMVGEAFRRQGYSIEERGGATPDGGVDLVLRRNGEKTIVQCKQWRMEQVGVNVVRELLGVVVAESAKNGILVCSGSFTDSAVKFARRNAIELIDGKALENLVFQAVRETERRLEPVFTESPKTSVPCPKCGSEMVRRVGKRGAYAGTAFLGCSRYPDCKGTRSL